jgi:alkyl sulfatase BDS1-like metallo-beta-lactamase superfamily hydrolase
VDIAFTDTSTRYRLTLRNGALTYTAAAQHTAPDAVLHLPSTALPGLVAGGVDPSQLAAAGVEIDGNPSVIGQLLGTLDRPDPDFAIVTP